MSNDRAALIDSLRIMSERMRGVNVACADALDILPQALSLHDMLIEADPPYPVTHGYSTGMKGAAKLYSLADHERLASLLKQAHANGNDFLLFGRLTSKDDFDDEIYRDDMLEAWYEKHYKGYYYVEVHLENSNHVDIIITSFWFEGAKVL